jgi:hypothetical protein
MRGTHGDTRMTLTHLYTHRISEGRRHQWRQSGRFAAFLCLHRARLACIALVREKTKTSAVARKLKRTEGATRQKTSVLGVKLVGAQRKRKP